MKTSLCASAFQSRTTTLRNGSASWGIVAFISLLSLALGLLIGVYFLSGSKAPQPANNNLAGSSVDDAPSREKVEQPKDQVEDSSLPSEEPTGEASVKESIQAAIETIEKKSAQMFVYSYLPIERQERYESIVERENKNLVDLALTSTVFKEYRIHLQSALNGSFELNPSRSVAIVTYKLKELPDSGMNLRKFARNGEVAQGAVYSGLGDDLPQMLTQAATLIEEDDFQKFVESVYPISEVEQLPADQNLSQLLARIKQPAMKTAMLRDLKDAAEAEADIQDNLATITLDALVEGDPQRVFKFDLVEGNWRFADLAVEDRKAISKLVTKLPASMKKGNKGLTIVFERNGTDSHWRIKSLPDTLPEW